MSKFSYDITLTDTQQVILLKWQQDQDQKVAKKQTRKTPEYGETNGYAWVITPMIYGTRIECENVITKERVDLTDYYEW